MYSFRNDYSEGAHPQVLQALTDTNLVQTCGYGVDPICEEARDLIRTVCAAPEADVHFLVGGTQTNLTVITALLASYEAVIAAHTGHVNCHETGASEATGHKVCVETSPDGKVTPAMVEAVLARHDGSEHMVSPKVVYISDTTEIGTVYTKAELTALRHCCDEHGLLLFLDGARLGYGRASPQCDVTLADIARLCDVFYSTAVSSFDVIIKWEERIRTKCNIFRIFFQPIFFLCFFKNRRFLCEIFLPAAISDDIKIIFTDIIVNCIIALCTFQTFFERKIENLWRLTEKPVVCFASCKSCTMNT